ncbi:MAG: glycosyltransferase family 2 protein [Nitrospinae bacterium]|nr:glycosyltransferase family 2 protein [Nitrospinota bacterium]
MSPGNPVVNNKNPAVSAIIPTFNRAPWLKEAMASVLSQNYEDFELLVVDDGSTDDTREMVKDFPEVRYIRNEENSGVSRARNIGVQNARGSFICFLDSDDLWEKDKLAAQMDWMERRPECRACYTDELWVRNGRRVNPMNKHGKYSGDIFRHCLPLCIVSPSSVMLQASLLAEVGGFDEALPACEDYDLWLRIAARYPFHFIPRKLIVKRGGHAGQLSRKYWGMDRFRVRALEKLLDGESLDECQRALAVQELVKKSSVLHKGFMKRENLKDAEYYQRLMEKYSEGAAKP